jgi:hypothetical protein
MNQGLGLPRIGRGGTELAEFGLHAGMLGDVHGGRELVGIRSGHGEFEWTMLRCLFLERVLAAVILELVGVGVVIYVSSS